MRTSEVFGPYRGIVDQVHDGDTVYAKLDVGFDLTVYTRIRILGINAPELSTEAGKVARDFARSLLKVGDPVKVYSHGWDKYGGRIDGELFYGGSLDFAATMIAAGQAVPYGGGAR